MIDGVVLRDLLAGEAVFFFAGGSAFFFDEVGLSVIVETKCPLVVLGGTAFLAVFPDVVDWLAAFFEATFGVVFRDFVGAAV